MLNEYQVTSRATNFFDSVKNEELPTPKKSHSVNELESVLLNFLGNKKKYAAFERFLSERHYDTDYLNFYVKVIEYKREPNLQKVNHYVLLQA